MNKLWAEVPLGLTLPASASALTSRAISASSVLAFFAAAFALGAFTHNMPGYREKRNGICKCQVTFLGNDQRKTQLRKADVVD